MARSFEDRWPAPVSGLAVDTLRPCGAVPADRRNRSRPPGGPTPRRPAAAGRRACGSLGAGRRRPGGLSGVGRAARPSCAARVPASRLADKRQITDVLLACGASIGEINCVRKHLSGIKGGRLAAAAAPLRRFWTLAISDVPGDDPATIASGPAIADPSTADDARAILKAHGIAPHRTDPQAVGERCCANAPGRCPTRGRRSLRAPPMLWKQRAAEARRLGLAPTVLGDDLTGEAAALGRAHARSSPRRAPGRRDPVRRRDHGQLAPPRLWARRAQQPNICLRSRSRLDGAPGIHAIACDTDGLDGNRGQCRGDHRPGRARGGRSAPGSMRAAHWPNTPQLRLLRRPGRSRPDRADTNQTSTIFERF